jgi:hypothetical protein
MSGGWLAQRAVRDAAALTSSQHRGVVSRRSLSWARIPQLHKILLLRFVYACMGPFYATRLRPGYDDAKDSRSRPFLKPSTSPQLQDSGRELRQRRAGQAAHKSGPGNRIDQVPCRSRSCSGSQAFRCEPLLMAAIGWVHSPFHIGMRVRAERCHVSGLSVGVNNHRSRPAKGVIQSFDTSRPRCPCGPLETCENMLATATVE